MILLANSQCVDCTWYTPMSIRARSQASFDFCCGVCGTLSGQYDKSMVHCLQPGLLLHTCLGSGYFRTNLMTTMTRMMLYMKSSGLYFDT